LKFLKKNLFIFTSIPETFSIDDSYLILGNKENLNKFDLKEFDNVFTIFYIPLWIKTVFRDNRINLIYLNEHGEVEKTHLCKSFEPATDKFLKMKTAFEILKRKVNVIDSLFKTKEAKSLLNYSLKNKVDIYTINENLNFIPKAVIMDTLKLNYNITNKRAKEITNTFFNLTENIVSYSFYNKFIEQNINPEDGFLSFKSPSLIRDLTEIQRLKFLKKLHHLLKVRFFDGKDLNRKHFPLTTMKFLKILSTYFFYANRFKRTKEIFELIEAYKRGKIYEIFSSLWYFW